MIKARVAALHARIAAFSAKEPELARFFAAMIAGADQADIAAADPGELEAAFRQSFAALESWSGTGPEVTVAPLPRGRGYGVDAVCLDMPFIVDSLLAAIRATGGVVRLIAHPVVPAPARLAAKVDRAVSVLHVAVEPLADPEALRAELLATLVEITRATGDWQAMLARLQAATAGLAQAGLPAQTANEARAFLDWLVDHNFTFLGMRDYQLQNGTLVPLADGGLGVLADAGIKFLRQGTDYVEMTPQHAQFLAGQDPILVTKANIRSRVHRRSHYDYVAIKRFGADGAVNGELRVLGLFTSVALATPNTDVPLVRRKIVDVLARSKEDPRGHAGKALMNALATYPRDELFQIDSQRLFDFATVIAALPDRPRVKVLPRIDRFDNFVSVLVYVPRERYNSDIRQAIGERLARAYDGRVSAYYPQFPEGELVRVHFIIGRNGGPTPRPDEEALEKEIADLTRNFGDLLAEAASDSAAIAGWLTAFPADYQAHNTPQDALADIGVLKSLGAGEDIALRFARAGESGLITLKIFHPDTPIPLSDRVPMLENFGFRVIDEMTYALVPLDGRRVILHEMVLVLPQGADLGDHGALVEAAILAVWRGEAENDGFNRLAIGAGLPWAEIAVLRGLMRYLRLVGIPYTRAYLASVLGALPAAATALIDLFRALLDPGETGDRDKIADGARQKIAVALDATTSLDEDRIIRRLQNLVEATLRTNAFVAGRETLTFKFDCSVIEDLPAPRPYREIYVYSPRVEGVHLRFGPIARGGLRWSDRPDDFRTEVLGLVKAQQVKNAVIVPVGAKGGFVPRNLPTGDRDAVQAEAIACYKLFVSSLLDLTDNLDGKLVVPPQGVLRRDGDDPYLVVAADKGTASFSDIANGISKGHDFWLGDAFASGGSVGYDHKKMAITARGAWEAVKRHFREMDRDIQAEPFTVAGVGDMSGDVFGNGMLLSHQIRLVAAFDHRDIFIDPEPDAVVSFAERARLFTLPRSSWQDYDKSLISEGGGVFSRSAKAIPLSQKMRDLLELTGPSATPAQVMNAILKAKTDLLWFGGIGTYVRAASETDLQAGDRANDAIRITGADIRARVVGEGANLAMTQRGRVEYALNGGRINTDAIDNSAGVNSSDLEVNIKIALGILTRAGQMSGPERDAFLPVLTDEVAALCLRNNYLQTLALSLSERRGLAELPDHIALMDRLEAEGELDRGVEYLPGARELSEREKNRVPLTRPEMAVLLAYAKNTLNADLLASSVPDDPYLGRELFRYFPRTLAERYPGTIENHRLRREVIATVLANGMINAGGPAFASRLMAMTNADAGQLAYGFAAARDVYGLLKLQDGVDALDGRVDGATQLGLYAGLAAGTTSQTLWFLRNSPLDEPLSNLIARHADGVDILRRHLKSLAPRYFAEAMDGRTRRHAELGVPEALAREIAQLPVLGFAGDVVLVSSRTGADILTTAQAFFGLIDLFDLGPVLDAGGQLILADRFDRMALDRALANVLRAQRDLTLDVLAAGGLEAWKSANAAAIARLLPSMAGLTEGDLTVSRLSVAAGLLSDLARVS